MARTQKNARTALEVSCFCIKRSRFLGNAIARQIKADEVLEVCAIEHAIHEDRDMVTKVVAIAGALENHGGSTFEYEVTRLKTSDSHSDAQKEGLRLVLKGGKYPLTPPAKEQREQKAIVEFLCDHNKKGTEGEWEAEDRYDSDQLQRRDDEESGGGDEGESSREHQLKNDDAALLWDGYGDESGTDVLRMTWYTQYACESTEGNIDDGEPEDDGNSSSHWGFFTWLVIM